MTCLKCGRKLSSAVSREAGYGPVCYRKIFGTSMKTRYKDSVSETTDVPYHSIQGQITMEEYLQAI